MLGASEARCDADADEELGTTAPDKSIVTANPSKAATHTYGMGSSSGKMEFKFKFVLRDNDAR